MNPYGTVKRSFEPALPPAERFVEALRAGCTRLDLGEELLWMVDDLAARSGLAGKEREALVLLLLLSLATVRSGSTRLPIADAAAEPWVRAQLGMLLTPATGWTVDQALPALRDLAAKSPAPLFGPDAAYVPFLFDGRFMYHQRLRHLEQGLGARLAAFSALAPADEKALAAAFTAVTVEAPPLITRDGVTAPMQLDPEQQYALLAAAAHRLCIISGGPGTGKTTIVVGILRMLVRLGLDPSRIALAAPTGKAAYRVGEAIGAALRSLPANAQDARLRDAALKPKTLHRLLGYSPAAERFRHDERNPLACDALVIDEASMIDLHLMDRLLRALPAGARLILLGDAHQLPSVDAGAVLRDLIAAQAPAYTAALAKLVHPALDAALVREGAVGAGPGTVMLRKAHRAQAGTSLDAAARAVNDGDAARLRALLARREVADVAFADLEWSAQARLSPALLRRWYDARIAAGTSADELTRAYDVAADRDALAALFARQTARVLCVTRVGVNGSVAVNERLHVLHRRFLNVFGEPAFLPGEPVLMLANDYDKNLFNGDQGLVLRVRDGAGDPHLAAVFARGDAFAAYALSALGGAIEHGYALTVHKSQGSEYPHVAVVLPPEPMPLVTREILYTALTRARHSALVVGAETVLKHAVENPEQRFTGLAV